MVGKHQRDDGTWTFTTPEWDAKWYWPAGTRVRVETRHGTVTGTVTKENPTTVRLVFDAPGVSAGLVPKGILVREEQA